MKTLTRLVSIISLSAVVGAATIAPTIAKSPHSKKHISLTRAQAIKWPQVCPVSGSTIASATDAANSEVYKGKTYYFCCPMCKPLFDKDPAKYISAAAKGKYLSPM